MVGVVTATKIKAPDKDFTIIMDIVIVCYDNLYNVHSYTNNSKCNYSYSIIAKSHKHIIIIYHAAINKVQE